MPGEARAGHRRIPRGDPASSPTLPRPTTISAFALQAQGNLDRADRRISRHHPPQARLRRGPLQSRSRPESSGEARPGHRRIPRGHPSQARSYPRPRRATSPWVSGFKREGCLIRRLSNIAMRSGSIRNLPGPTVIWGASFQPKGTSTGRSTNTASPSGSTLICAGTRESRTCPGDQGRPRRCRRCLSAGGPPQARGCRGSQ